MFYCNNKVKLALLDAYKLKLGFLIEHLNVLGCSVCSTINIHVNTAPALEYGSKYQRIRTF